MSIESWFPRWIACALLGVLLASGCASTGSKDGADSATSGREVEIEFTGLESLSRAELLGSMQDELVDFRRSGFKKWPIDDAAYRVERRFAAAGYPFTQVEYRIQTHADDPRRAVVVEFVVRPGPRTRLVDVLFEGARAYPSETLRAFFGLGEGLSDKWYASSDVGSGLSGLEERYLNDGYVDVRIADSRTLFSEDRSEVTVTVDVDEGERYVVGGVALEMAPPIDAVLSLGPDAANEAPPSTEPQELIEALGARLSPARGETFRLRLPYELRAQLQDELGERGYLDAVVEVQVERDPQGGEANLRYDVTPGERVIISAIEVRGNESTTERTILRRLAFAPGDIYTRSGERSSFERLYRLGIFRGVSLNPERRSDGSWICVVEVEEARTADWYVEPGYGSYERARLTLGFRERNLFGLAVPLRAEVTAGDLALRGEISLAQPGLFAIHPDLTGELKFFGGRREEPSFTEQELGITTGVSYRWSRELIGALEYQFKQTDVTDILVDDASAAEALGDIDVSSVAVSLSVDTRDNVFLPESGGNSRISAEFADGVLGSELDFTRVQFTQGIFHSLGETTVLAFGWQIGAILPHGDTDEIPLQERFFNGGENSVRSFFEDDLSPTGDNGKPLGGEAYSIFSTELRQELSGNLGGAIFVDFGTLAEQAEDVLDFSEAETGVAIGLGLRYFLPIGPVRFDLGWNPEASDGADDLVGHLSVGMAF